MKTMADLHKEPNQRETAEQLFKEGLAAWRQRKIEKALRYFQKAHDIDPDEALFASYLGVTLVKAGIFGRGLELCKLAVRRRPFNGDLLYNLGQAYLFANNRAEARKAFLLGAKSSMDGKPFLNALLQMGVRRKPVIGFLSRDHFLNRWLGKLTYRPDRARVQDIEN